jgi:hypothetical protein
MARWLGCMLVLTACGDGGGPAGAWNEQDVELADTYSFGAVWAFGPNDVWAGGTSLVHFDGAAWTKVETATVIGFVTDMWGFAPDDLWAVDGSQILHWDGTAWAPMDVAPYDPTEVNAVFGIAPDDVWVGGGINGEALHFDGDVWTQHITQAVMIHDLWGSGPDDVWAAGFSGLQRWNGTAWTEIDAADVTSAEGLWGFGPNDVWAVGSFGTLAHWDGAAWTNEETDEDHLTVWGASSTDVWAAGEGAVLSHWDGSSWSSEALGLYQTFEALHGASAGDVWAAGYIAGNPPTPQLYHYRP